MPRLSVLIVRTALVWLGVGYTLGGLALFNKGVRVMPWLWTLRLPHVYALLFGWTVQLALGVAFWILPRLGGGSRGNERLVWLSYFTLNLGVLLSVSHDPLAAIVGLEAVWPLPVLAALLILIAIGAFVAHAWRRVLPLPVVATSNPPQK